MNRNLTVSRQQRRTLTAIPQNDRLFSVKLEKKSRIQGMVPLDNNFRIATGVNLIAVPDRSDSHGHLVFFLSFFYFANPPTEIKPKRFSHTTLVNG